MKTRCFRFQIFLHMGARLTAVHLSMSLLTLFGMARGIIKTADSSCVFHRFALKDHYYSRCVRVCLCVSVFW